MISKINFTPSVSTPNCRMQKNAYIHSIKGLQADTVSFTSKENTIEQLVTKAFGKLAQTRRGEQLGTYMAKTDKVNIFLQETKFGKEAKLTLTNGIFGNKSYVNFNIKRAFGKPIEISSLDDDVSSTEARKLVQTYLQDIK